MSISLKSGKLLKKLDNTATFIGYFYLD